MCTPARHLQGNYIGVSSQQGRTPNEYCQAAPLAEDDVQQRRVSQKWVHRLHAAEGWCPSTQEYLLISSPPLQYCTMRHTRTVLIIVTMRLWRRMLAYSHHCLLPPNCTFYITSGTRLNRVTLRIKGLSVHWMIASGNWCLMCTAWSYRQPTCYSVANAEGYAEVCLAAYCPVALLLRQI